MDIAEKVAKVTPNEAVLFQAAELLKIFGDSTRIRIIFVLCRSELCVCDIAKQLNMTQSAISHQLKILRSSKLIKARRDGKMMLYSLADEHVKTIIAMGMDHVEE
jgi:ArsR family transcriptional regulator